MNLVLTKPILLTDPLEILIKGCRENDLSSQESLYRHCYPEMIKICYRYAGDMDGAGLIFNNAMLRIFSAIHTYKEQGKFIGWIKTIVVNCCLDFVKQQNKFRDISSIAADEEQISIAEEAVSKLSAKEILVMIGQLPKATATVLNLYVY